MTRPELLTAKRLTPTLDHLHRGPWTQIWWTKSARWGFTFKAAWYTMLLVIIDASTLTINLTGNETLTPNKAGYGDDKRQLASTNCAWCVRPRRSSRSSIFSSVSPLWASEHLRMVFFTLQWCWTDRRTWLARLCGTQSALLSRKTSSREGDSDAFKTIGKISFSSSVPSPSLTPHICGK